MKKDVPLCINFLTKKTPYKRTWIIKMVIRPICVSTHRSKVCFAIRWGRRRRTRYSEL